MTKNTDVFWSYNDHVLEVCVEIEMPGLKRLRQVNHIGSPGKKITLIHHISELPLRAGLLCATQKPQYLRILYAVCMRPALSEKFRDTLLLMLLCSTYEPHL